MSQLKINRLWLITLLTAITFASCNDSKNKPRRKYIKNGNTQSTIIVDCHYTFDQAIEGSKAPKEILDELQLIDVKYYSTDGKIHVGQVLTNKLIAHDLRKIFEFILRKKFPVAKVIPVVHYHWDDNKSMQDNNSYSFCYRNIAYSKHARGLAMDINPFFNPVRWKEGYEYRTNKPVGAVYNVQQPGTFYLNHPVVKEFKTLGFRWGHSFTRNYDDHHFEKYKFK